MSTSSLTVVKFAELLDNKSKGERYLMDAVGVYIDKWTPAFLLRELDLYKNLHKGDIRFTGDEDTDLREAVRYQLQRRVERFPEHQIALHDSEMDSVFGLINGAPLADCFVQNPQEFGTYLMFSGQFVFDFPTHLEGKNKVCPSVVSRRGGGKILIVAARNDAISRGERTLVLTRLNGYKASGDGIPVTDYVGEIIDGRSMDETSALSLHAKIGREVAGNKFELRMANGTSASFRGAGFGVANGGILQHARPADIDSDGYCVLGEHKVERVTS